MGDALKDKRSSKKLAKDGVAKSTKTAGGSGAAVQSTMASPAPVDNPNFDKLPSVQKDWVQREWIETVNGSMKRIVDFLNKFGM